MQFIIIIWLAIITILLIVLLVTSTRTSNDDEQNQILKQAIYDMTSIKNDMANSMKILGDMLLQSQRDANDRQNANLKNLNDTFHKMNIENEQKLENIRRNITENINKMTSENNIQLEKMRETVDEKLQNTLETRLHDSFELVQKQINEVSKGLGEMKMLADGVGDLKKVLSNVKTRGVLGEAQLQAIIEQILAPSQYETNIATKNGSRDVVEFAIKLPGNGENSIFLPIDAKFPSDLYQSLVDAYDIGDKEVITKAQNDLMRRIKDEAKKISEKYIDPVQTTPFAIMFLPFEGLYAEVTRLNITSEIQEKYRVMIAGPSNMAAMLTSFQMGFQTIAIQERSDDVWKILKETKTEFTKFQQILEKTRKKLGEADKELETLMGTRTRAINRKLRNVELLEVDADDNSYILNNEIFIDNEK